MQPKKTDPISFAASFPRRRSTLLLAGSLTALLASRSAHAAIQTWANSASNLTWDATSLSWSGAAWTNGNDAVFGTTGAGAITVSGTQSVGDLTVSSAGYSFSGGILSVAKLSAANNWTTNNDTTIASGVTANVSAGAITGTLTKLGAETLTLSGAVSSTGVGATGSGNWGITVSAGSLELSGTSTFSSAGLIVGGRQSHHFSRHPQFHGCGSKDRLRYGRRQNRDRQRRHRQHGEASGGQWEFGNLHPKRRYRYPSHHRGRVDLGTSGTITDTSVLNLDGGSLQAVQLVPSASWKGTSTINLNGGTFRAVGSTTNLLSATMVGVSQPGSVFVKAGGAVIDPNGRNVIISSNLLAHPTSPGGGLTKLGGGATTLTLSGVNTYTGPTIVNAGVLAIKGFSIANSNELVLNGGKVDLTGAETIGTLFFGTVQQAAGTYSATGAGGTVASSNFTGAGTLIVTSGPPVSGFSTWASANAGGQTADQDFDKDGMPNGAEYFMGETGSTFTANPPVVTVGGVRTVTWPRDPAAVATFKVQITDTLAAGSWIDVVPPNVSIDQSNPNQITCTLPSGAPTKFCRLSVTP